MAGVLLRICLKEASDPHCDDYSKDVTMNSVHESPPLKMARKSSVLKIERKRKSNPFSDDCRSEQGVAGARGLVFESSVNQTNIYM